jgi:HEAT repeat protein
MGVREQQSSAGSYTPGDQMPQEVTRKSLDEVTSSIVQLLQTLYTATKTVHIYPTENPSVVRMIEQAHDAVCEQIPVGGALDMSYMEEKLIINGGMLDDFMQKRGIIRNFHELMKQRRISSITFWDGVTKDELRCFLVLLGTKAATFASKEEEHDKLESQMEEEGISRIEVDEQIFVAISKREKVVDVRASVEREGDSAIKVLKDEVFSRFLAGEISQSDFGSDSMQQLIADPEKMVEIVHNVVESKGWGDDVKTLPYRVDETRAVLERMSSLIEQVDDPLVRSKLNREVSKITSQMDTPDLTEMIVTSAGLDAAPTEMPRVILPLLGDQKLSAVVESIVSEYQRLEKLEENDEWPSKRTIALKSIIIEARTSAGGELSGQLDQIIREDGANAAKFEDQAAVLGLKLGKTLSEGGKIELCDIALGPVLVTTARYLFEHDEDELGAHVIGKLAEKFEVQSPDAKAVAAQQLWRLIQFMKGLGKDKYTDGLEAEVKKVVEGERAALQTFSTLSDTMGHDEETGEDRLATDKTMIVSARAIEKLMTADTGKVLQAVFTSGDKSAQEAITKVLLGMESKAVPALVQTVVEATDDETVESVADSLNELETDPIPQIAAQFSQEHESIEIINLIKLVALVGDENSVSVLNPLLLAEDPDIHIAVILALGMLGGKQALQMLLSESVSLNPVLRAYAVRELGKFREYLTVRRLTEIVTPKKKGEFPEDEYVVIAACRSLGDLRVHGAVDHLGHIGRGGKRKDEYSEELRAAAASALGAIGGDQAANMLRQLVKDRSLLVRSTARKALSG